MRTAQTGQDCAKNLNILWFEPIEKASAHYSCPFVQALCVHVSYAPFICVCPRVSCNTKLYQCLILLKSSSHKTSQFNLLFDELWLKLRLGTWVFWFDIVQLVGVIFDIVWYDSWVDSSCTVYIVQCTLYSVQSIKSLDSKSSIPCSLIETEKWAVTV